MTTNQLQYNQLLESTRHNAVTEEISRAQQVAQERYWNRSANSQSARNLMSFSGAVSKGIDYFLQAFGL